MLRINRETDYAIRVILALAKYPHGEFIPSAVIREEMKLPPALSLQIISKLVHLDLVKSTPGRNGGIQLARLPEQISLHDVVSGMEGPVILSECLEDGNSCELSTDCPVQSYWERLQKVVENDLKASHFKLLLEEMTHQPRMNVE